MASASCFSRLRRGFNDCIGALRLSGRELLGALRLAEEYAVRVEFKPYQLDFVEMGISLKHEADGVRHRGEAVTGVRLPAALCSLGLRRSGGTDPERETAHR